MSEKNLEVSFKTVMNYEGQFSVLLEDQYLPPGWNENGFRGTKEACLAEIVKIWTDLRPLSIR
jgi:MbtH protein